MNYYIKVQNKNRKNDWCYWEIDWENYMIRPIKGISGSSKNNKYALE